MQHEWRRMTAFSALRQRFAGDRADSTLISYYFLPARFCASNLMMGLALATAGTGSEL
jgi:hypothetical protein